MNPNPVILWLMSISSKLTCTKRKFGFITIFFLSGASSRLWQIIDKNPTIPFDHGLIPKTGNLKGNISFDNIDFSYPSRPDISVLKNLSLHVPSDHVMAVVGGSGSGKSTLASLLLRLYDPDKVCNIQTFIKPNFLESNLI